MNLWNPTKYQPAAATATDSSSPNAPGATNVAPVLSLGKQEDWMFCLIPSVLTHLTTLRILLKGICPSMCIHVSNGYGVQFCERSEAIAGFPFHILLWYLEAFFCTLQTYAAASQKCRQDVHLLGLS